MKKLCYLLFSILLLTACDDGNIIVTSFNFDGESALKWCRVSSNQVMYIVNSDPEEAIAFNFMDPDFTGGFMENDISQTRSISLSEQNRLVYRTFDGSLNGGNEYFCSGIPLTHPKVKEEYVNKNGGIIELVTYLTEEEIDEEDQIVVRTFENYATAHNITLKNVNKEEEIVEEVLKLGFFRITITYDLDEFLNQE